ncbi:MAG: hypothetical protein V3S29_13195 [bacterium]
MKTAIQMDTGGWVVMTTGPGGGFLAGPTVYPTESAAREAAGAPDYEVGDVVLQDPFGGGRRQVVVTARHIDVKNGRPGFSGHILGSPATVWGYDVQVAGVSFEPEEEEEPPARLARLVEMT